MAGSDAIAQRRAELERRLAALSPEKRAQLERARAAGVGEPAPRRGGIVPREPGAPVPMSYAQELLWLLDRASPGMHGYNVPRTARLRGGLDVAALQAALDGIVARHEVLRSTFDLVDDEPRQIVHPAAPVALAITDLSDRPHAAREAEALALVRELSRRPFDLTRDPQLRASLIRLGEEDHVLLLESHHVSSDAWSRNILMRELSALYDAHHRGEPSTLAALALQYGDFARWQRDALRGAEFERHIAFWRDQLRDAPALLELPTDRPRPTTPSFEGATRSRMLPAELLEQLRALSKTQGSTLFVTLLAAFDVLLARTSGQEDIVVGSPTAGRAQEGIEGLIGYFANTLVLRTRLDGDPSFAGVVARVRETTLSAFEHQDVPYEKLALELQRDRALGRGGLFQVMFTLQDAELRTLALPGLHFEPFGPARGATKFDLSLFMHERAEGLRAAFEYRTDLFDAATIDRLLGRFETLLEGIVANPDAPISTLPVLPLDERLRLQEWSYGATQPVDAETLHEMIAQQVARTPDATAVEIEQGDGTIERMTFRELDTRAATLARFLNGRGVGPNMGVGICVDRSTELVVAMLGVLKAGSYYLPLDPDYPADRLAFMLQDSKVPVLLTTTALVDALPQSSEAGSASVVLLDRDWELVEADARLVTELSTEQTTGDGLAYVIYTSGSTGRPKGVMIPHRAVVNYLAWMRDAYPLDTRDGVLQKAPASFDACIWEFFLPLVSGARLVLARPGGHQDPAYLLAAIARHDVTLLQLVPSQLNMMLETPGADAPNGLPRLRRLFLGGEALPSELLTRLGAVCPTLQVTNLYGPTEATVYATHWSIGAAEWTGGAVPIGTPITNASVHVVAMQSGGAMEVVPIGVAGELCIGGVGLAHGYLARPELTDEKFVPDPFVAGRTSKPRSGRGSDARRARLYRTGDRARWRADGTLEYLGRIDNQVKLRGFRVELGEVESALAQQPGVQSAVALVREDTPGDQRLVAYCIGTESSGHTPAALRSALKATLPEFMVPTAFVWLAEWPMNANGKLDRKALPAPASADAPVAVRVAPRTPTEEVVAALWGDVLQRELGAEDDFFELGGHSLLALRVLAKVGERLGVRVPLRVIFESSTVAAFAARVDELRAAAGTTVADPIPRGGDEAPLTHLQELFWLVERNATGLGVYNVADQWHIDGTLDLDALRRALDGVVQRHESLRSVILDRDGGPVQVIRPPRPVSVDLIDLVSLEPERREQKRAKIVAERSAAPFDLSADLLLRATVLRLAPHEHVLLLVSHHVVYDGWSRGILLRELAALYARARGERAPALTTPATRFADYAAWQRRRLDAEGTQRELRLWLDRLGESTLAVALPTDRPRPSAPTFEGGKRTVVLPLDLLERLRQIARANDATMFMVLLAGFEALLHRYTGQDEFVLGTIVAGRGRAELEGVIGNFVNTIPLRAALADDPTFRTLLSRVKEEYLHASEHAELPFETLSAAVQRERGGEASGFAQVHFVLQNNTSGGLRLSGTQARAVPVEATATKFDLSLSMGEQSNGLRAAMQYRSALFDAATIDRMLGHLAMVLDGASRAPDTRVSALPLVTERERVQLLEEWNGRDVGYARDAAVHELVAAHAARAPEAIAVSTATGQTLSYGELETRSNQLAWHLQGLGARSGSVVGICMESSPELIVAMLGTLKTGAAYLTLDPSYPSERLSFMVEDAAIAALVTSGQPGLVSAAPHVSLTADAAAIATQPLDPPPAQVGGGDVANIIYTSGTTGRPKGTLLPHRGITRLVTATNYMQLGPSDVMGQVASPAFDALTWEVWGALLNGARLAIVPRETMLDASALRDELQRSGVTTMLLTTAVFNQVARVAPDALRGVRNMLFGGEAADVDAVRRVLEHSAPENLVNAYGPSEASVIALTHRVTSVAPDASTIPVGSPIANTRVYVLDRRGALVPVGVPGELHVAGDGTAIGYLNRPDLTAERFIANPLDPSSGERLYRTGDLARWMPGGEIEFIGRADNQVKIRGVRIELAEIEAVISAEAGVAGALAMVREVAPGDARLLCYYVPTAGETPDEPRIRAALRRVLPQNMMPSALVALPEFPLTRNGKVDRQALPLPQVALQRTAEYKAPRTTIEHELVQIWEKLLDRRPIGIREDFFEIGGHSLMAVRMLAEIARVRGRHVPLAWLFESSTIEALGARIGADVQAQSEPPLVVLQAETPGRPIAFVHGDVRGAGWYCRRLAPLVAPDAPMLVLPTLGADEEDRVWRIRTMAERHVAELRKVQPHGPYRLAGFCVGGIIAFEMARQLRASGEAVERLIVIDSTATNARIHYVRPLLALMPGEGRTRLARQAALMTRLRRYDLRIRQVAQLGASQQFQWVRRNVTRRWRRLVGRSAAAPTPPQITDTTGLAATAVLTDAAGANVLLSQAQAASAYIPSS
ncbi:MAG: amino acid adenylation domain-containing protein, partial [Gemmatimonadetes bacterium]|nr:amino acid adenylation domain-containing protein [Gemmatimonadota bacterium]